MGISPYISSSIFMAFLFAGVPSLREWRKDQGASGVDIMTQATRKVGLLVSLGQAVYTAIQLRSIAPALLLQLPMLVRHPRALVQPALCLRSMSRHRFLCTLARSGARCFRVSLTLEALTTT